jgi:hypothetical protein
MGCGRRQRQQCLVQHVRPVVATMQMTTLSCATGSEGKWRQAGSSTQVGKGPHGCSNKTGVCEWLPFVLCQHYSCSCLLMRKCYSRVQHSTEPVTVPSTIRRNAHLSDVLTLSLSKPSSSVSSWLSVCSRSSLPTLRSRMSRPLATAAIKIRGGQWWAGGVCLDQLSEVWHSVVQCGKTNRAGGMECPVRHKSMPQTHASVANALQHVYTGAVHCGAGLRDVTR